MLKILLMVLKAATGSNTHFFVLKEKIKACLGKESGLSTIEYILLGVLAAGAVLGIGRIIYPALEDVANSIVEIFNTAYEPPVEP